MAESSRSIDGLAEKLFPVLALLSGRISLRGRLSEIQPAASGLAGPGLCPLDSASWLRPARLAGRLSCRAGMLAGHGLLAAMDPLSLVWTGRLPGPKRCGRNLYRGLVLALLAPVAGPQARGQKPLATVGGPDLLAAFSMAFPLWRGLGA